MDRPRPRRTHMMQLATQQLRLRSLTRIQGVNIFVNDANGLIYYSLHHGKDEEAFYTSEALPQHLQQKWTEIVCPHMLKSNKVSVCVKVWLKKQDNHPSQNSISAFSPTITADKLLFSWGVFFSGLTLFRRQSDINFIDNSLIFQINGAYFTSPQHINEAKIEKEISTPYQRPSTTPLGASTPISHNPFSINSPNVSRSTSPTEAMKNLSFKEFTVARLLQLQCRRSDVRSSYDLEKLLRIQEKQRVRVQKIRECLDMAADIRQLSIRCITPQQLQRRTRCTSVSFSSLNQPHSNSQYHSMGRTLSILLAEERHIEPAMLLRAQKLQQQIETLRCRHGLLLAEKKAHFERNTQLDQQLRILRAAREQLQNCLKTKMIQLEEEKVILECQRQENLERMHLRRQVLQNVERRMSSLCIELREIYPIRQNHHGFYTICGIQLPSIYTYINDSNRTANVTSEHISPLALSASFGYLAHLVQMIAVILDRPLRNPIIHEGSKSRIQDNIKDVPYGSKDFPLYTRSTIPSKLVKYAFFLLNQNIAQFCADITGSNCDLRATIENLLRIFQAFAEVQNSSFRRNILLARKPNNHRLNIPDNNSVGSIRNHHHHINISTDEIDGFSSSQSINGHNAVQSQTQLTKLSTLFSDLPTQSEVDGFVGEANYSSTPRISRSVGSYSDDDDDDHVLKSVAERNYSSSDSKLSCRTEHHNT